MNFVDMRPRRMGPDTSDGRGTTTESLPDPDMDWEAKIPKDRYTSNAFMETEWATMWPRIWHCTKRVEDIPRPGDYFTYALGKENFIIVRDPEGRIRAFYNVCLHRGNQLRPGIQAGHAESFQCSYHLWEWNLDGTLKNIPDRETFPQKLECDKLGLVEIRVDTWGGFIFINMDKNAMPLDEYLDPIPTHLAPYQFERLRYVADLTVEWDCNWKTSVDAFNESYHAQGIHPQLMDFIDDYNQQWDCYPSGHARMLVPQTINSPRVTGNEKLHEVTQMQIDGLGLDSEYYQKNPMEAREALIKAKRAAEDLVHFPYKTLSDEQLTDDYHYTVFPNWQLNTYAEGLMIFVSRPHETDPNKMYWDLQYLTYPAEGEEMKRPPWKKVKQEEVDLGSDFLKEILDQDAYNLPYVQNGMNSRAFDGLIVGRQEVRVKWFHEVLMDYVEGRR